MTISKNNITKNISKNSSVSLVVASEILESFLFTIKSKSKQNVIKLSSFGTFAYRKTPKRIGRNPRTKDSYIIPELNKLNFKPSKKITNSIN